MSDIKHTTMSPVTSLDEAETKWKENRRREEYDKQLTQGFVLADSFLTQRYLDFFSMGKVCPSNEGSDSLVDIRIYKINKMVFDPDEQVNDKFISVFSSLHNLKGTVALIISSHEKNVDFYIAVRSDDKNEFNANLVGSTLHSSLKGNFPGIEISESLDGTQKRSLIDTMYSENGCPKSLATVSLIPSERDKDKNLFVQGIEKFINGMNGKEFNAIFLAAPVSPEELSNRRRGFEGLYSNLSPHAKISMSYAQGKTDSVNESISKNFGTSVNRSISNSTGTSESSSSGSNVGSSSNFGFSGDGYSSGFGSSSGSFSSYTTGSSFTQSVSESTGKNESYGHVSGEGQSTSETDTTTLNFENKSVQNLLERIQSELKRIDYSESYGMWDFCAYFFSDDISVTIQAASFYKALMMGEESAVERAHVNIWTLNQSASIKQIINYICFLRHPLVELPMYADDTQQLITPTNMLNGRELPLVLGFPRKSIPGLAVVEMAEFGRAVVYESTAVAHRTLEFGSIYHMGVVEKLRVPMNLDLLSSHCFITGSSGSGKSYATYQLLEGLINQGIHMMVIEPAKGEYKQVFGGLKGIRIFTTDPNVYKMLRINPFQFPENIHVLTHIEKLIQIFNASWSLTAAMPALLKEAVVSAYRKCGWDLMNSVYLEGISDHKYPVFRDVLDILPELIDRSNYSADAKGDYKGALLTRVQSMTSGIAGVIFERSQGVSDHILFDSNTIIDLSDIGSEETIALLMGILIMRLGEYRQSQRKAGKIQAHDALLSHVTVLEEAHNLLKRTNKDQSQEGSNIVGKSVEMISNSIKEMRTYGEGFIIIDQSPMAVDSSAIENTSTKIIMNTPAKDACEELSSTLSLTAEQSRELSRLPIGVAAVFQKGWLTPVLMKVDRWKNRYEAPVKYADLDELQILRGKLVNELYAQSIQGTYYTSNFKMLIRESDLDSEKKKDYEEICLSISKKLAEHPNGLSSEDRGLLYLEILNCEGLLAVITNDEIPTIENIQKMLKKNPDIISDENCNAIQQLCTKWVERFKSVFHNYAYVDSNEVVDTVIREITQAKAAVDDRSNPYGTIMYFISGKKFEFLSEVYSFESVTNTSRIRVLQLGLIIKALFEYRHGRGNVEMVKATAKIRAEWYKAFTDFSSKYPTGAAQEAWGALYMELFGCKDEMDLLLHPKIYSPKRLKTLIQKNPEWFGAEARERLKERCVKWRQSMSKKLQEASGICGEMANDIVLELAMANCCGRHSEDSPYTTVVYYLVDE